MPELSGTIKFVVPGPLDLEAVWREIRKFRTNENRIPEGAPLTRLKCRVEGEMTKCSVSWERKPT
jgi:hypothetical protein